MIKKYGSWETACKEIEKLHKEGVKRKYGVNSVMDIDEFKINTDNKFDEINKKLINIKWSLS